MALVIDNISKTFGEFRAIEDVSFTVEQGRMFGFLGTNGAGKTTTMRMVLDILRPDSGSITWNGIPNVDIPRDDFGYLPEERGLYPKMTVQDQLLFLAQLYGADQDAARRSLDDWLARLDIEQNRHRKIEQLSKGNQQKIQFLAAVLHDPEILILDEPFSGLDPVNVAQLEGNIVVSALKPRARRIARPGRHLIVRSNRPYPKTEGIVVRNTKRRAQAIWLAITPGKRQTANDAAYRIKLVRR